MIFRIALLVLLSLTYFKVEAKIIETCHINDVISLIDEDTWFLVDLDNCMFEGSAALGHANWFYDELDQRMQKGMTRNEAIKDFYPHWIKTQSICSVKPLESHFIPTLLLLQDRKIVIMGLTHRQPLIADSTLRQVQSLGFDFTKTAPAIDSFIVPASTPTLYLRGVLFVGDYNKKIDIFEPFLNIIGQKPKKVVFIDDKRKNVEELEKLTQQNIEYIGVHYTAIDKVKPIYDPEIAAFQYKYLGQILSNEAVEILIENGIE